MKKFRIVYESETLLSTDELWPDGNGPDDPTHEDVRKLILDEGGISKIMDDWNLSKDFFLDIYEDSEWDEIAETNPETKGAKDNRCPKCEGGIIQTAHLTPPDKGLAVGCNRCSFQGEQ